MAESSLRASIGNKFQFWYRLLDDILILGNEQADAHVLQIYPSCLKIEPTCVAHSDDNEELICSAHFLDIKLNLHKTGQLYLSTCFKTDVLPFAPIQYIRLDSNRPKNACYNVLIGMVISVAYHNSTGQGFISDVRHILMKFRGNGFQLPKCLSTISKGLERHNFAGSHFDVGAAWGKLSWQLRRL
jgi:hypothetical protein